jgi:beta-glucosidase
LLYSDGSSLRLAAEVAHEASVAVVVVYDKETESRDRTSLSLPGPQDALVAAVEAANPRTVVVLETGAPVLLPWLVKTPALLETWYPGDQAGLSLAQLLSGQVDPSGKLPVTWPATAAARPDTAISEFGGGGGPTYYYDGIDVGYRWYQAKGVQPAFSFGDGLSYTQFRYSRLSVAPRARGGWDVTASVTNIGARPGADVAQCYVGYPAATGEPPRQLRGFQRVELLPNQTAPVRFELTPGDLSEWSTPSGTWTVTAGRYTISVGDGSDAAHLPLQATVPVASADLGPDGGPGPT